MATIRRTAYIALFVGCALLFAVAPASAATGTYVEGVAGAPFSLPLQNLGPGMTIDPGDGDAALVLHLDGLPGGITTAATSTAISGAFVLDGAPADKVSFLTFRIHMDYGTPSVVSPVVRFTSKAKGTFSGQAQGHQNLATGEWLFQVGRRNDGEYPGGGLLRYKLAFTLPNAGASGTITVYDFALDYGEYVEPPDDGDGDDGAGGGTGGPEKDGPSKGSPSGVAYMGGSGAGAGGTGSGSGTGGGTGSGSGTAGGGSAIPTGVGSVDTDATVAASPAVPAVVADDTVTGFPLRLADVLAGDGGSAAGESAGGSGGAAAASSGGGSGGGRDLTWSDLLWVAAALAIGAPFVSAAIDRRRALRRLHALVDETPDGPAPRATAPA